jgi:peptidoglycan/xylan/chitin deacetylase (PgdA/CDA1 family)
VSLSPATFRDQLAVLADHGGRAVTLSAYLAARDRGAIEPGTIVLTFDDAYRDFVDAALPELDRLGWKATVFVPILPIDASRSWDCGDGYCRDMLDWQSIGTLARSGIEMAAHSMSHRDLTTIPFDRAIDEIAASRRHLEMRIGCPAEGFAPPFGRMTRRLGAVLPEHYAWSAGARMGRATHRSDRFDLPRIEMWYFRHIPRWRRYVAAGWTPYSAVRAALRAVGARL